MPAPRYSSEAKESGKKAIKEFVATFARFEEDLPGDYSTQCKFTYTDVIITEQDDTWKPEGDILTEYLSQGDHANSTYMKKLKEWETWATNQRIDWEGWESLLDRQIRFRRVTLSEARVDKKSGQMFAASYTFVPIAFIEDGEEIEAVEHEPVLPSDELIADIVAALEGETLTVSLLERAVKGKRPNRENITACGGMASVLNFLVDTAVIAVDEEGAYSLVVA